MKKIFIDTLVHIFLLFLIITLTYAQECPEAGEISTKESLGERLVALQDQDQTQREMSNLLETDFHNVWTDESNARYREIRNRYINYENSTSYLNKFGILKKTISLKELAEAKDKSQNYKYKTKDIAFLLYAKSVGYNKFIDIVQEIFPDWISWSNEKKFPVLRMAGKFIQNNGLDINGLGNKELEHLGSIVKIAPLGIYEILSSANPEKAYVEKLIKQTKDLFPIAEVTNVGSDKVSDITANSEASILLSLTFSDLFELHADLFAELHHFEYKIKKSNSEARKEISLYSIKDRSDTFKEIYNRPNGTKSYLTMLKTKIKILPSYEELKIKYFMLGELKVKELDQSGSQSKKKEALRLEFESAEREFEFLKEYGLLDDANLTKLNESQPILRDNAKVSEIALWINEIKNISVQYHNLVTYELEAYEAFASLYAHSPRLKSFSSETRIIHEIASAIKESGKNISELASLQPEAKRVIIKNALKSHVKALGSFVKNNVYGLAENTSLTFFNSKLQALEFGEGGPQSAGQRLGSFIQSTTLFSTFPALRPGIQTAVAEGAEAGVKAFLRSGAENASFFVWGVGMNMMNQAVSSSIFGVGGPQDSQQLWKKVGIDFAFDGIAASLPMLMVGGPQAFAAGLLIWIATEGLEDIYNAYEGFTPEIIAEARIIDKVLSDILFGKGKDQECFDKKNGNFRYINRLKNSHEIFYFRDSYYSGSDKSYITYTVFSGGGPDRICKNVAVNIIKRYLVSQQSKHKKTREDIFSDAIRYYVGKISDVNQSETAQRHIRDVMCENSLLHLYQGTATNSLCEDNLRNTVMDNIKSKLRGWLEKVSKSDYSPRIDQSDALSEVKERININNIETLDYAISQMQTFLFNFNPPEDEFRNFQNSLGRKIRLGLQANTIQKLIREEFVKVKDGRVAYIYRQPSELDFIISPMVKYYKQNNEDTLEPMVSASDVELNGTEKFIRDKNGNPLEWDRVYYNLTLPNLSTPNTAAINNGRLLITEDITEKFGIKFSLLPGKGASKFHPLFITNSPSDKITLTFYGRRRAASHKIQEFTGSDFLSKVDDQDLTPSIGAGKLTISMNEKTKTSFTLAGEISRIVYRRGIPDSRDPEYRKTVPIIVKRKRPKIIAISDDDKYVNSYFTSTDSKSTWQVESYPIDPSRRKRHIEASREYDELCFEDSVKHDNAHILIKNGKVYLGYGNHNHNDTWGYKFIKKTTSVDNKINEDDEFYIQLSKGDGKKYAHITRRGSLGARNTQREASTFKVKYDTSDEGKFAIYHQNNLDLKYIATTGNPVTKNGHTDYQLHIQAKPYWFCGAKVTSSGGGGSASGGGDSASGGGISTEETAAAATAASVLVTGGAVISRKYGNSIFGACSRGPSPVDEEEMQELSPNANSNNNANGVPAGWLGGNGEQDPILNNIGQGAGIGNSNVR